MSTASQQSQSGQTQLCGPNGPYILTKVSRSGRRYFFNGTLNCIGTEKTGAALVAQTTFEPSGAYQFLTLELPESIANQLNKQGIGGTPWCVAPFQPEVSFQPELN